MRRAHSFAGSISGPKERQILHNISGVRSSGRTLAFGSSLFYVYLSQQQQSHYQQLSKVDSHLACSSTPLLAHACMSTFPCLHPHLSLLACLQVCEPGTLFALMGPSGSGKFVRKLASISASVGFSRACVVCTVGMLPEQYPWLAFEASVKFVI